ncbi:MAG TPA: hypothetical protein VE568_09965, partial [Rubrobacter sp.]|nr:hypothetical protein [Rubrobacter sp.]
FVLDGRELYARTSIGIAMGEVRTKDPDDLLRDADTAMYRGVSHEQREDTRPAVGVGLAPWWYERHVVPKRDSSTTCGAP